VISKLFKTRGVNVTIFMKGIPASQKAGNLWSETKVLIIPSNVPHHPRLQSANHILCEVDSQTSWSYFPPFLNSIVAIGKTERHVRKASHCGSKQQ